MVCLRNICTNTLHKGDNDDNNNNNNNNKKKKKKKKKRKYTQTQKLQQIGQV
jgi:hypothetical protein